MTNLNNQNIQASHYPFTRQGQKRELKKVVEACNQRSEIIQTARELRQLGVEAHFKKPYRIPDENLVISARSLKSAVLESHQQGISLPEYVTTKPEVFASRFQESPDEITRFEKEATNANGLYDYKNRGLYVNPENIKLANSNYEAGWLASPDIAAHEREHDLQRQMLGKEKFSEFAYYYVNPELSSSLASHISEYAGTKQEQSPDKPDEIVTYTNNVLEAGAEISCKVKKGAQVDPYFIQLRDDIYKGNIEPYMQAGLVVNIANSD